MIGCHGGDGAERGEVNKGGEGGEEGRTGMKAGEGRFEEYSDLDRSETRVRLRIRWRASDYSGGRAERALSAGERQQGGADEAD